MVEIKLVQASSGPGLTLTIGHEQASVFSLLTADGRIFEALE